jgi:anti-sigma factor RsiW
MQHLDEGTIHAWIDGALDAEERARVEAHVGECAACAAAVAEARGLVAGASRVLLALDAGIGRVPAEGGRVATGSGKRDAGRGRGDAGRGGSVWRALRLTPMRAAAAAVLMVGAGSVLVLRERGQIETRVDHAMIRVDTTTPEGTPSAVVGGAAGSVSASAREVPESAPRSLALGQVADSSASAPKKPALAEKRRTPVAGTAPTAAVTGEGRLARTRLNTTAKDAAAGRAAAAPVPAPEVGRVDSTRRLSDVAVATVPDRSRMEMQKAAQLERDARAPAAAGAVVASGKANAFVSPSAEAATLAGCYVLTSQPGASLPARLSLDTTAAVVASLGAAFGSVGERRAIESRAMRAAAPAAAPPSRPAPEALRTVKMLDATGAASPASGSFWSILPSGSVRIVLSAPSGQVLELRRVGASLTGFARGATDSVTVGLQRVECRR